MSSADATIPAPFSFAPSQNWKGNDGAWSSFVVKIGTPAQGFEVFPSTTGQEILIPLPEGCTRSDTSNCAFLRGVLPSLGTQAVGFQINSSSTWDLIGLYTSNLENTLGYVVNAEYGFDQVGLQVENSNGLTMNDSIVGGIASKDFYLGVLGLGPKPSNFSTFDDPTPSLMMLLNSTKEIPSISYGYTAGAAYRFSKVHGSLTLGGYDSTRFESTDLSIPFAGDDSRPLQVAIQSITGESTLSGVTNLLPTPVYANIDSALPYIWLTQAACDNFQSAFGLTYDNVTELYLVNSTMHTQLLNLNPTVTFQLGRSMFGGTFQNIVFPYAAFDLEASYPFYDNATKYFPIRRAANDTQYTLGRAFLQEAYVVADYERKNFTVAQANFSATMPSSQIVRIISPGYYKAIDHESLSVGAVIGIVIGAVVAVTMVVVAYLLRLRRRRRQRRGEAAVPTTAPDTTEPEEFRKPELMGDSAKYELPVPTLAHLELDSERPSRELDGRPLGEPPRWIHEAEGSPGRVFELPGTEVEERHNS